MAPSLSEAVILKYPEHAQSFRSIRSCQYEAMKWGGAGIVGGGGLFGGAMYLYAKAANPLVRRYIPTASLVGGCLFAAVTSWTTGRSCLAEHRRRTIAAQRMREEKAQHGSDGPDSHAVTSDSTATPMRSQSNPQGKTTPYVVTPPSSPSPSGPNTAAPLGSNSESDLTGDAHKYTLRS